MAHPKLAKGVTETVSNTFEVRIMHKGVYYYLGTFKTLSDANKYADAFRNQLPSWDSEKEIREQVAIFRRQYKAANEGQPVPSSKRRKSLAAKISELEKRVEQLEQANA